MLWHSSDCQQNQNLPPRCGRSLFHVLDEKGRKQAFAALFRLTASLMSGCATESSHAIQAPQVPGLHAQLGLLYAKTGDTNKAFSQFAIKKQLFPESAPYMDFLMSKKQGVVG